MFSCVCLLIVSFVMYGVLSIAGENIYKKEGIRVLLELIILSVNFAIWFCEISEIGGIGVLFNGGLGQVIHPNLLLATSMVIVPSLLIEDSTPKWFGNWFGLSIIETIVVLFMGASYFGTGKFLGGVLVAAIGTSIGSIIVAVVSLICEKKRKKDDLRDAIRDAMIKTLKEAARDKQNKND